ncbi:MAG: glycosyltransferase [bacterium]|nr:glycosyltransferase [bacterium]
MPLVTIAIPNFNQGHYLDESLASALSQTYRNIEIVVVDNASTDNSRQVIEHWAGKDSRVRPYFPTQHTSIPIDNWNRCLEKAQGTYINFLHADDRLTPTYIEKCLEVYQHRPDLGYVYSEKQYIDGQGNEGEPQMIYRESGIIPGLSEARVNLLGWHTVPVQTLMRTECLRAIGGYNFTDSLALLLLNLKWDVGYLKEPLVQYRKHPFSASTRMIQDKSLVLSIHLTKTFVLNACLPDNAKHLMDLHPQIMQRLAYICLHTYGIDVLAWGDHDLCRQYMHLAASFWLEITDSPLYQFLAEALGKDDWTSESLRSAWAEIAPQSNGPGAPYPLPAGSLSLESGPGELKPTGENL